MAKKDSDVKDLVPAVAKQTAPIISKIEAIEIVDEDSKKAASIMLHDLKEFQDKVVAYKEAKTKPLNQALKVIRDETRQLEADLKTAIDATRAKLGAYQTEQKRIADKKADDIAARVGEGRGHFTPETAMKKIDELDKPSGTVDTGAGEVKFRTVKKLVIFDDVQVKLWAVKNEAWALLAIDEATLKHVIANGTLVDGARIDEVQEAASYR